MIHSSFKSIFISKGDRFLFVDIIRALAVFWVMLFHSYYFLGFVIDKESFYIPAWSNWGILLQGHFALDVFLVLSGFLICDILLIEIKKIKTLSLKNFYSRRAFRILPVYYFVLLLLGFLSSKNITQVWANILYVNNFIPISKQFMPWAWSLALEEQFYILLPLFLLFVNKLGLNIKKSFYFLLLLSIALRFMMTIPYYTSYGLPPFHPVIDKEIFNTFFNSIYDNFITRFGPLIIGCLLACFKNECKVKGPRHISLYLGLFLIISMLVINPHADFGKTINIIIFSLSRHLFSLGIALSLWALLDTRNRLVKNLHLILFPFAQLSYSAYLIHPIIMIAVYKTLNAQMSLKIYHSLFLYPVFLAFTFIFSILLFTIIEAPFLKLRTRLCG